MLHISIEMYSIPWKTAIVKGYKLNASVDSPKKTEEWFILTQVINEYGKYIIISILSTK